VAAEKGDLDTVCILLDHGAELGEALSSAAAKGYGDIMQLLLDAGADLKNDSRSLLIHTVEYEHVLMFRMLVERGCAVSDPETVAECVRVAEENGLVSMLQLVKAAIM
jgi:ankyrin repeat protein